MSAPVMEALQPAPIGITDEERLQHNQGELLRTFPDSPLHVARFSTLEPHRFLVMKWGGEMIDDPDTLAVLANDVVVMQDHGLTPLIVNGGGPQIDRALEGKGSEKAHGVRITPPEHMPYVADALAFANQAVCAAINERGGRAMGFSRLFAATLKDPETRVADKIVAVETRGIEAATAAGNIVVVSCLGTHVESGEDVNVNGDLAGKALASAVRTEKYIAATSIGGVEDDTGQRIPKLNPETAEALIQGGVIHGGMVEKVRQAVALIEEGNVHDVVFTKKPMEELFTDEGEGTIIHLHD